MTASSNRNNGFQEVGHFADSTQIIAKRNENDDGEVINDVDGVSLSMSLKWIVIICLIFMVTLAINAIGCYCYKNKKNVRKSKRRYQFEDIDDLNVGIKK